MIIRPPSMNIDDPVECLTHPAQVIHALWRYPADPERCDRWSRFIYPALDAKEDD